MIETGIFLAATAAILYVSRASLRVAGSHGFRRFFAWEFLLLLFLLNVRKWFAVPFSPLQIVSWVLLFGSLFLALHGVQLLRRRGQADAQRTDAPMYKWEKTTVLVTEGAYRYIRHPLYSSLFFLGWGIFFKAPSWPGVALAAAASLCLVLTARAEEAENLRFFGPVYQEYMKRTKLFVPFIF